MAITRRPPPKSLTGSDEAHALPTATIIIPTLNESRHIGGLLDQLLRHAPPTVREIMVADGGSTDGTRDIVHEYEERDRRVRLIDNPCRIQSVGVNLAALASDSASEVLVRMDAHADYGDDFVEAILSEMRRLDVDSVVVRMRTEGSGCFQRAVAFVSNSASGTGGSSHRMGNGSRYVDHGHHAAIRRTTFLAFGGYDESFAANEDGEFDHRLVKAQGSIWLCAEADVRYFPRETPKALARQYFRYGVGRLRTVMKHRAIPKARQTIPVVLTLYLAACLPAAMLISPWLLLPLLAYVALLGGATLSALMRYRTPCALGVPVALAVMHLSWGSGFLVGLMGLIRGRHDTGKRRNHIRPPRIVETGSSSQNDRGSPIKAVSTVSTSPLPERVR